jgi:hypothetical protein
MQMLLVEIALALASLRRGWRAAPVLLLAAGVAAFLYAPAGIAHGLALVALAALCAADPAEPLARPPRSPRGVACRGALYQI